jgi:hypothetical protein
MLAAGDPSRLGGVNGPQAVCSDGEGARVSGLYLSQLGPQRLREVLHKEVVEGEVPLHPQRTELQRGVQELAGRPPAHGLHLHQHVKLLVNRAGECSTAHS